VLDASHVGPFDGIALALLDLDLPALPERIAARERECVYLDGMRCALPAGWRTVKCWSFYCLGGRWNPGVCLGEYHGALAEALKGVVRDGLPDELRQYEVASGESLIDRLDDPTDFAHALDDALYELLVQPLHARYPLLDEAQVGDAGAGEAPSLEEAVLTFVAGAIEKLFESLPLDRKEQGVPVDQLLADLELIEWIVVGRPSNQGQLLSEMQDRYAALPDPRDREQAALKHQLLEQVAALVEAAARS
jgi:hypothetical protein